MATRISLNETLELRLGLWRPAFLNIITLLGLWRPGFLNSFGTLDIFILQ